MLLTLCLTATAVAKASAYAARPGAIIVGGDVGVGNHTIAQAKAECDSLQFCVGFTFECATTCNTTSPTQPYRVYFKSISATNTDPAWRCYLKLPTTTALSIDTSSVSHTANPLVMGCHSDSGYTHQPRGFYAQMVVGASFEAVKPTVFMRGPPQPIYWNNYTSNSVKGGGVLDTATSFHGQSSMKLVIETESNQGGMAGVTNRGLGNEGLVFQAGKDYNGYFFAYASAGAPAPRFVVALRDYVSGTMLAQVNLSATATVGGAWQRLNFSLTPSASTSCVNMSAGDAGEVHCAPAGAGAQDHICVKCGGEIVVALDADALSVGGSFGGHANIDYVYLQPGRWARLKKRNAHAYSANGAEDPPEDENDFLPVLASTVSALQRIGVSAIRQGGSFTDPSYYFWKRWRGPVWARPSAGATWGSSYEDGWGPFEFIDMCEAAGLEPIVTTTAEFPYKHGSAQKTESSSPSPPVAPAASAASTPAPLPPCCSPADLADLIEYTHGNASTAWGRRRIADGHPRPYPLRFIELGNEQYNTAFVEQVSAMERRAREIGKPDYFYYIFPSNGGLNSSDGARAVSMGLDTSRILADLHVGYGGAVEDAEALFAATKAVPGFEQGAVNLETNAATHTMQRALAEAADINDFLSSTIAAADDADNSKSRRLRVRTASFCTERSGHYDAFDQGLVFFLPNMTWLQPPAHTHAMIHQTWLPQVLNVSYGRSLGQSASAQMSKDGKSLAVRYVNSYNSTVKVQLHITPPSAPKLTKMTQLKPPANALEVCPPCPGSYYNPIPPPQELCCSNPPWQPDLVAPTTTGAGWSAAGMELSAPPFSYSVLLFEI